MSQPANDEFSQHLSDDEESNHEDASDTGAAPKQQQQVIPQTTAISNIKLPILKKEEYDIWAMEMEHYLEYIDNDVWKVIQNGNSKKRISTGKDGIVRILSPVTAAEIQAVEKERKAKNILLMAIPKEHMRRFHGMDDAKEIWEAIRTRFGGNANSKKMQKAVFKQQFEAFKISSSEGLEKGYDRFQQLLSQLEAHGAEVSTEDGNHKQEATTSQLMARIDDLEKRLKETKQTFGKAILTLVERGKSLEFALKRKTKRSLLLPQKTVKASGEEQVEDISPTTLEDATILIKVKKIKSVDKGKRYKRRKSSKEFAGTGLDFEEVNLDVNTGIDPVTTDSIRVSVPSPDREEAGLAEAIRLDALEKALEKEEVAKQVHLDSISSSKKLNLEEVKAEFEKLVKQLDTYVPMNFEATKESLKRFGEELQTKTAKKLKFDDEDTMEKDSIPHDKMESEDSDEANEKDDSTSGTKIPINPVPVATKSPSIANYKIIKQGRKGVYQIVRENGTDMVYISFGAMLTDISRDDLTELYRIVMRKHGMNEPEDEFEKVLWEYLKNMFEEPLSTYSIWSLPGQQRIICWRYYDACRVHCLNLESVDVYMLIERKYPLSAEVCKAMLDKKLQGGKPDEDCYKLLKMMEKQAGIRKHKDWLVQEQTTLGKDFSNPLMADNLPKIVWLSTHHIFDMVINPPWNLPFIGAKGLTSPEQMATVEMVFSRPWTCTFLVAKGLTTPELMANW
ncbi:hypothetical protein Tco_0874795 [Tanacetum coccineum]|uniref:Uncharacterized protein n=1 Tax=Tanacetum coccineum TaxID=301880 RepID=A0ABQ5BT98_9ASTR